MTFWEFCSKEAGNAFWCVLMLYLFTLTMLSLLRKMLSEYCDMRIRVAELEAGDCDCDEEDGE